MDARVARGVEELNQRRFFEAHEVWEEVWLETVGPERQLLQGLIQIAAGYLKAESGNHSATIKLLSKGLAHVRQFVPRALGLDLSSFVEAVAADLITVQRMSPATFNTATLLIPKLHSSTAAGGPPPKTNPQGS